jgi:hypothetical protein
MSNIFEKDAPLKFGQMFINPVMFGGIDDIVVSCRLLARKGNRKKAVNTLKAIGLWGHYIDAVLRGDAKLEVEGNLLIYIDLKEVRKVMERLTGRE